MRTKLCLAGVLLWTACSPRQAVVETDPRGGEEVRRRLEAAIRSDLVALLEAQESHHEEAGRYIYEAGEIGFIPSAGVEVDVLEATTGGFSALGRSGTSECALFVGSADPPRSYAVVPGEVACRGDRASPG